MQTALGMILFLGFVVAGVTVARDQARRAGDRLPQPVRRAGSRARSGAQRVQRAVGVPSKDKVREIWAGAHAANWLEEQRGRRTRREAAPPKPKLRDRILGPGVMRPAGQPKPAEPPSPAPSTPSNVAQLRPVTPARPAPGATPAPSPDRPSSQAPAPALNGRPVMTETLQRRAVPPDYAALIARINTAEPESDADYLRDITGHAHGMLGLAEAFEGAIDHLLNSVGLDPAAVQCWHDIAGGVSELARLIQRAESQYRSTYAGTIEDAERGVTMPHNGRFFSGETS